MLTCSVRHGFVTSNTIQLSFSLKLPPVFSAERQAASQRIEKDPVIRKDPNISVDEQNIPWMLKTEPSQLIRNMIVQKGPAKKHNSIYQHPPSCSVDKLTNHQDGVYWKQLFDVWLLLTFVTGSHGHGWCTSAFLYGPNDCTVGMQETLRWSLSW